MTDDTRKALRLIGEALILLSAEPADPAAEQAPADPPPTPRRSTRAMLRAVRPEDMDIAAAKRKLRAKGVPIAGEDNG